MGASGPPAARDRHAEYDYRGGEESVPESLAGLPGRVSGDVRFDAYSREMYATDASIYEQTPIAVVLPTDTEDVRRVMAHCWEAEVPVLPRGAGTSLAGQAVNEAVVLDLSRYMDRIIDVDETAATCRVQPGVVLASLDEELAPTGLQFAPDPAWGDKSTLGGAIGNNSTGAHSLRYGKTDAYLESCEVVLADGTVTELGWMELDTLAREADPDGPLLARIKHTIHRLVTAEAGTIEAEFPDLHRNVAGYNLDRIVADAETGAVNLARVLAGSEGTLATVTEATVGLEPVPETAGVALLTYPTVGAAMADVSPILAHDPAAVEVIDDVLLDLAAETEAFGPVVADLAADAGAVLLVECQGDDEVPVRERIERLVTERTSGANSRASGAQTAFSPAERERFWKLRKSGLPILLGRTSDEKHIAFIEDTAVPASALPEYVAGVQDVLADHDTFASFYGHAGPGCLHIRPLVNTKTPEGIEAMEEIAAAVTDLAIGHGGTVAGEHGDGRARTQWTKRMYGPEIVELFRELKAAWDPKGLLNPGQVCGAVEMTDHLRFDPNYSFEAGFTPELAWENDNGLQGMVELCHGCGGCRGEQSTTGGVMCPTFRASQEEITSTRGRANMLRRAMSGALPTDEHLSEEFLDEVLDLCIGCKGCARDCPSEVDMAKLKAELTHVAHQRHGASIRERLFANLELIARFGSATAPVSNWLATLPFADRVLERTLGIAADRDLPRFVRQSFTDRFDPTRQSSGQPVYFFPDIYTNYVEPEIGMATVSVLETLGYDVRIPDGIGPSGRAAYSLGFLEKARERARHNVATLEDEIGADTPLVVAEPSDAVMLQSDYADLLEGPGVTTIADHTYGVLEFLDRQDLPDVEETHGRVTYHGHCHQKATQRASHAAAVLDQAGFVVETVESGCCGMAGSFGYEAEHYAMSKAIARILYDQLDDTDGERVVATGASCRTQLRDHLGARPEHPIEAIADVW